MNNCPCCSAQLLRHIRDNHIYWLCPRCRQAMPVLETLIANSHQNVQIKKTRNPVLPQPISMAAK
ncbi:MAG TPA: hypothetical protein DCL61_06750 [Cyanobacteria bacterium UBA12227]|nr:hypothetical protein [Cyanobacteria bacterium UBA12227]HAX90284.1 hypothetical protein [Cyanobacteria bacterium UBA11370]HBY79577.1 hypothetical protein [Cyanobacteria bacterium UBA11148]